MEHGHEVNFPTAEAAMQVAGLAGVGLQGAAYDARALSKQSFSSGVTTYSRSVSSARFTPSERRKTKSPRCTRSGMSMRSLIRVIFVGLQSANLYQLTFSANILLILFLL